jgi:phosphoribosylamine--glycine ligase
MRVLLLGSGGREHALAWKLSQSPLCQKLFVAPGNAGTRLVAENVPISPTDFEEIARFCLQEGIGMLIVGPEEPLVKGISDFFANRPDLSHIPVIGPSQSGARLEGSKDFAKAFMQRHQIPTASYRSFTQDQLEEALAYLQSHALPIVLKADGLAAGKGVIICQSLQEAAENLKEMLSGRFGEASRKVVIEQFLKGIELSVFVLTDGKDYVLLPEAKDYKRIGEGDTGANTGGMGAVSPVPFADKAFMDKVVSQIIRPTLAGLEQEGIGYCGFIFFGLIRVEDEPYVIEYNCRMGDPETQVVMSRLESDLLELCQAVAQGRLAQLQVLTSEDVAATVVLVSGGYPEAYKKGIPIYDWDKVQDVTVFHAGTMLSSEGQVLTNGGRVLALTGRGKNLQEALKKANLASQTIAFEKKYFRKDIGFDLFSERKGKE